MTSPPTARSPWTKLVAASGLSIVFNGWGASSDLMSDLLNANQPIIDQLTDRWIVWKRNELQFVALTNALITATVATCVTWPNVKSGPIGVLACWYSSLLMSIISITCAIQQSNALFKLGCREDGNVHMRKILQSFQKTGVTRESRLQHFIWQSPIMLLNFSILIFVVGLLILIFSHALLDDEDGTWKEKKVIIAFAFATVISVGTYLIAWLGLYQKMQSVK